MKVLKTIVATAVIVFALTTVAMAGVQHFTKQGGQAGATQAQPAQPTYTVTLTAAQFAQLMNGGKVRRQTAPSTPGRRSSTPSGRSTTPRRRVTTPTAATMAIPLTPRREPPAGRTPTRPRTTPAPRPPVPAAITPRQVITPAVAMTADPAVTDHAAQSNMQEPATARRLLRRGGRLNPGRIGVALSSEPLT